MKTLSIKIFLSIFVLLIAMGCEKDDNISEVKNSSILKIPTYSESFSFKEFSTRLPEKGKRIEDLNSGQLKSSTNFNVDTSFIQFKRFLDFESYTLSINSSSNSLQNLVIFENIKTNKKGAFITQYNKELKLENVIKVDEHFNLDFTKVSCSWEVLEFHTPPGSSTEWSYDGTNCQHMNDDGATGCAVRYSVVVDCPEILDAGDSGGGGGTTPNPNPPSDGGGGWAGGGGDGGSTPPSTTPEPEPCSGIGLTNPDGSCGGALTEPILITAFFVFTDRMDSSLKLKWNTLSDSQQNQIEAFLEANKVNNLYTDEAKAFAEEAIKALTNNGDIDLENRLIYNPIKAQNYRNRMSPPEIEIFDNLNILQKEGYLRAATQAYIYSESHFSNPVRNRLGDAFKHTFWNALSTVYIGEELTQQLTTAHEDINYDPDYQNHFKETQMDLYNNNKGRQIAYGEGRLYELVHQAMDNGELRYLNHLMLRNGFWNATNSSTLTPTNQ